MMVGGEDLLKGFCMPVHEPIAVRRKKKEESKVGLLKAMHWRTKVFSSTRKKRNAWQSFVF